MKNPVAHAVQHSVAAQPLSAQLMAVGLGLGACPAGHCENAVGLPLLVLSRMSPHVLGFAKQFTTGDEVAASPLLAPDAQLTVMSPCER